MRLPAFSLYPAPQPPTQADPSTGDTNGWVNRVSPPGWGRRDCLFSHVETSPVHLLLTSGPGCTDPCSVSVVYEGLHRGWEAVFSFWLPESCFPTVGVSVRSEPEPEFCRRWG